MKCLHASRDTSVKILLSALALALLVFQYRTLAKLAVFHPATSHISLGKFLLSAHEMALFDRVDALLLWLLLCLCCGLVALELYGRGLSAFLQGVFTSKRAALLLLLAVSLVCVRYYFALGKLHWSGDAAQHVVYTSITARELAQGHLPTWTFAIGNGSPYLQNYGFLFFYLSGLFALAAQDLDLGLKLCLAFGHLLSGLGMYLFVGRLCRSRRAGFIAALSYVLSFWHVQQVLIMGRLPLSLFYGLMPFAFYAVEMLGHKNRRALATSLGALALACLFFTHPGYGTYAGLSLGFYTVVRLWTWRGQSDIRTRALCALVLLVGGALFSAYMTLGMWAERDLTNMHALSLGFKSGVDTPDQIVPDPTWRHLLGWSNFRFWLLPPQGEFHWYGGYLGITLVALALAGALVPVIGGKYRAFAAFLPASLCLVAAAWVVFAYRLPPLNTLYLIQNMNAARYLLFLVFFLAVAAGVATRALLLYERYRQRGQRLFALLLLALFADLGSTTFLHPYMALDRHPTAYPAELFAEISADAQSYLKLGELPPYRILWPTAGNNYLNVATVQHLSQIPTADAFHPGDLRALETFTRPFIAAAHRLISDLESVEHFSSMPRAATLSAGFHLLNARHIMLSPPGDDKVYFLLYRQHSPILVAPELVPFNSDKLDPLALIDSMQIDAIHARSQRLFVRGIKHTQSLAAHPQIELLDHRVYNERVLLRVRANQACFARLAYAYSPYINVSIDGQSVQSRETAGRFLALELTAGEHLIELDASLSPLRRGLLTLDLILLVVAAIFIYREQRNTREE